VTRAVAVALAIALAAVPAAAGRQRRLHLPAPPRPRSLTIDEAEWTLRASHDIVAAGPVRIHVYDRGQDAHNFVIVDGSGVAHVVSLQPGADAVLTPSLTPGRYHLFCSLFAGTPESHEAHGMWFNLEVR
jgi:hypothetical protein